MDTEKSGGRLYVVATPLGNLADLGPRAAQVLSSVAVIAAEDTRHSRPLLAHYGIRTPLAALHEHNEAAQAARLIERLRQGDDVALISDAGTPAISDPGERLVAAAHAAGVTVLPVPGPCAAIAALSASGLASARFAFEGFLPAKAAARRSALMTLTDEPRTLIFYEAPHRLSALLEDVAELFGDRPLALAKELTKLHEAVIRGTATEIRAWLGAEAGRERGEFVLLIEGAPPTPTGADDIDATLGRLLGVLPLKQAVTAAAALTDAPRNAVYRRALALQQTVAAPTLADAGSRTGNRARKGEESPGSTGRGAR
jgi:16S rRNA (cytidine1402-2'-O)-methyltransferase